MARMPQTIAALQRGVTIRVLRLVQLDFVSTTKRVHQGFGPVRTADGSVWEGIGELGQISEIDRGVLPSGGGPTLTLSGIAPELIGKALTAPTECKGQPVRIFDQHFGDGLEILDAPLALFAGLMDRVTIQDDGATATITVTTVSLLHAIRRPAFGYLNAASQKRLYPGDRGLDDVQALVQRVRPWPVYALLGSALAWASHGLEGLVQCAV